MILVVNGQFSAVGLLPIGIQVHNHRKSATGVVLKLIEVFFVKTAWFIPGVMKFVPRNARVTSLVEVLREHKKGIFVHILEG